MAVLLGDQQPSPSASRARSRWGFEPVEACVAQVGADGIDGCLNVGQSLPFATATITRAAVRSRCGHNDFRE
jgi:hypothetical protein